MTGTEADEYEVERVRDALARDERVSELELEIRAVGGKVLVTGAVPTEERRRAITDVVREVVPDREVVNETTVTPKRGEDEPETLT